MSSLSSTRSHLLATSTSARPASITRFAIFLSSTVNPCSASITSIATCARSIASVARTTLKYSTPRTLVARAHAGRIDEADRTVGPLHHRVDRVAGGAGFLEDDRALLTHEPVEQARLPDVRPPTSANLGLLDRGLVPFERRVRQQLHDAIEQVAGGTAVQAGDGERIAESRANGRRSHRIPRVRCRPCWPPPSTGTRARRRRLASAPSSSVTPDLASTISRIRSARSIARSAWSRARTRRRVAPCRYPAVSTKANRLPRQTVSSSTRSRVTPGRSCEIASRPPKSRFTSVDLPTFWRPTTAMRGTRGVGGTRLLGTAHGSSSGARSRTTASAASSVASADRGRSCRSRRALGGLVGVRAGVAIVTFVPSAVATSLDRSSVPLRGPAPARRLGRGSQVELHWRVGEDHRRDVAAFHDRAVRFARARVALGACAPGRRGWLATLETVDSTSMLVSSSRP